MVNGSAMAKGLLAVSFVMGAGSLTYLALYGDEDDKHLAMKIIKTVKTVKIS